MRLIDEKAIEKIALGAALLGTGGGGDPYIGKLMAIEAIRQYGPIQMLDPTEVPDDAFVVPTAMMGAPTVLIEKIANGNEFEVIINHLEKYTGQKVFATLPIEAGGVNSMLPFAVAAKLGIPIVDCDGMGRAFPELQMVTFHLDGITTSPMVVTDEKGNSMIMETVSNTWSETLARTATITMGGSVMISIYSMFGHQLKKSAIYNTLTLAENIGAAITDKQESDILPIDRMINFVDGYKLFTGKIVDILRETRQGFNFGKAKIAGINADKGESCEVDFQNENLVVMKGEEVLATTPDLITIVDLETGVPITTEALKYGRRVVVVGLRCDAKWRTKKGIETVGPRYFKYDIDYVPIEERVKGAK
jgi:hypothetical protein